MKPNRLSYFIICLALGFILFTSASATIDEPYRETVTEGNTSYTYSESPYAKNWALETRDIVLYGIVTGQDATRNITFRYLAINKTDNCTTLSGAMEFILPSGIKEFVLYLTNHTYLRGEILDEEVDGGVTYLIASVTEIRGLGHSYSFCDCACTETQTVECICDCKSLS
ncbi:MAG: hypothetical protein MUD10_00825 [Candidatus Pacebacteria bacterium]|jgi:hypothetical protein|nr:hypothetical protein [Candidatus Paceibacterota bacterium]